MSTQTEPRRAAQYGPERFQRAGGGRPEGSRWRAVPGAVLLLVIVLGLPALMIGLGGVPHLPTSWPTREQLTGTIGVAQVMSVLVWVVWLAWLQFVVAVVVELASALSGVGLPRRVPLAGPSQRLARTLVASLLLVVMAAGQAQALSTPAVSQAPGSAVTVSAQVDPASEARAVAPQAAPAAATPAESASPVQAGGEVVYRLGDQVLDQAEGAQLVGRKVYVVHPPEGRHHDNLWDIAERTTGDGRRYAELFELNKGRSQPDGRQLTLARLIQPNWLIVVPDDAVGAEVVTAVAAPAPVAPVPSGAPAAAPASDAAGDAAAPSDEVVAGHTQDQGSIGGSLWAAGLLAAGLLASIERVRRRRRTVEPSDDGVELEVALRVGADPGRAERLDEALRHVGAVARAAGVDLPGVYAVTVDDDSVRLHLAPPRPQALGGWRAQDDGRSWVRDATGPQPQVRKGAAPFPALVSLGRDASGTDVLVDLEAAQGPIAVVGDAVKAREVISALAVELATNRWSDSVQVIGVGLPSQVATAGFTRYEPADRLAQALPSLRRRVLSPQGAGVLHGRLHGQGIEGWVPQVLLVADPLEADEQAELRNLSGDGPRGAWAVVVAGELPGARWRLEVDSAGSLSVRVLDLTVVANRLNERQLSALGELLVAPPEPVGADGPGLVALEGHGDRPAVPAPRPAREPADLAAAPVQIRVLGAPRVVVGRPVDEDRRELLTELVVLVALHPDGVHPNVLAGSLWPRGVSGAVRDATIERARGWLGEDPSGYPHLREDASGRLVLGPQVVLDWDVLLTLLARARSATDRAAERRDLTIALRMVQSPMLGRRSDGRYAWFARVRLMRLATELVVDAAHRLAVLCLTDGDPAAAHEAAWSGLAVAPSEELLWRDVLRAAYASAGPDAVLEAAADLELTLHAAGSDELSPQTEALLDELVPRREGPDESARSAQG